MTLDQVAAEWLSGPGSELAPASQRSYIGVIRKHIVARLGRFPVAAIDTPLVRSWMAQMKRDGVSPDPRARALKYLRMLFNFAIEHGHIQSNPAALVKMPQVPAADPKTALSPREVEAIRRAIQSQGRPGDSILVALMAYAGLRPSEAIALKWRDVGKRTISVRATKTNTVKSVRTLAPLAAELNSWRMACGRPGESSLVAYPPEAARWSETTYANWRDRIFSPAAMAAGFVETRISRKTGKEFDAASIGPYHLRHSFASLLIHGGYPVTYVAQQMRHSVEMTTRHYAHVIADFDPSERIDPEAEIQKAQGELTGNLTNADRTVTIGASPLK